MVDSPSLKAAWNGYQSRLDAIRERLFENPIVDSEQRQVDAQTLLQQAISNVWLTVMMPRSDYPSLRSLAFDPDGFTYGAPCPDFKYYWAFLDGRRRWRITGKRSNSVMLCIQVMDRHWSEPGPPRLAGNYDIDIDFEVATDGTFEIIVSAERPDGVKNWMYIDPTSTKNALNIREGFHDISNERNSQLQVELLDNEDDLPSFYFDEAEYIHRLEGSIRMIEYYIEHFSGLRYQRQVAEAGYNVITNRDPDRSQGGSPAAGYSAGAYDLQPDEALLIEWEAPQAKYWGIQLASIHQLTTEFMFHQSSLNGGQVHVDSDGRARYVIAATDPGVPNWLDPVGRLRGHILTRWYFGSGVDPTARLIKLGELRDHLPADTPQVTPEQRRETLRQRRRAFQTHYG